MKAKAGFHVGNFNFRSHGYVMETFLSGDSVLMIQSCEFHYPLRSWTAFPSVDKKQVDALGQISEQKADSSKGRPDRGRGAFGNNFYNFEVYLFIYFTNFLGFVFFYLAIRY